MTRKKPTTSAKRRTYRPRRYISTRQNIKNDVYAFKRRFLDGTIAGGIVGPFLQGKTVSLSNLPAFTEFAALFDRYMITYVKVFYHLKIDPSAQSPGGSSFPKLYYIRDYDDSSSPANIDELRQHSKCTYRVMNPNKPVVFGFRPATLTEKYRSPISTTYSPQWNQWIDMATTDVPHYGYKVAIDDLTNANYKVDVEMCLWFKCKDTR